MVFRCATLSSWLFYGKVATWQPQNFLNVRLRCQQRSIEICGDGNPAIKGSEKIPGTRMESFQSELRIFFLKSLDNLCWSGWPIDRFLGERERVCERESEKGRERERKDFWGWMYSDAGSDTGLSQPEKYCQSTSGANSTKQFHFCGILTKIETKLDQVNFASTAFYRRISKK